MSLHVRPAGAETAGPVPVDLVVLTQPEERFVVHLENGRLTWPRILLDQVDGPDLRGPVVEQARRALDLDLTYLGLLAFDPNDSSCTLVVAASVPELPGESRLRPFTLAEIKAIGRDVPHRQYLDAARQWNEAALSADDLSRAIRQSMKTAVNLLTAKRAEENDQCGWDQYLERDSVGIISTANGILAGVHARADRGLLAKPIDTLRAFQDPNGGWPIRRSLMGADSNAPITESTCVCLWALHEAGHWSVTDPAIRNGIAWLERTQRPDGGWPSAAADDRSLVFPTASAVRVLALFNRSEPVSRALEWLRDAQCADGGWGPTASSRDEAASSSAAYTAAAVLALSCGRVPQTDKAVKDGCDYLIRTFSPERPEPWTSTSFTSVVDPDRHARMDFRHFATPWALAALCEAGYDLSDPVVLSATRRLLSLQQPGGAWRCDQTAPDDTAIWAMHGAVFALRTVVDSGARSLAPLIRDQRSTAERQMLESLACSMLARREPMGDGGGRSWLTTAWMSALTVAVALLILGQTGVLGRLQSSSDMDRLGSAIATFLVTIVSAVAPAVIADKFRLGPRRRS